MLAVEAGCPYRAIAFRGKYGTSLRLHCLPATVGVRCDGISAAPGNAGAVGCKASYSLSTPGDRMPSGVSTLRASQGPRVCPRRMPAIAVLAPNPTEAQAPPATKH